MEDNYEKYAIAVIIVFGAVIIGGLMAANLLYGDRSGFLFALGAATAAWVAGHAMLFDRPRIYGALIVLATLMSIASTITLVT
jgi:hypothetical protein